MKIKALVSFTGAFSMYKGEVKECNDEDVLQDLLNCGYVEKVGKAKEKMNADEENETQEEQLETNTENTEVGVDED